MLFGCYTLQKTSAFSSNKPVIFIGNQNFQRGKFSKISFFFSPLSASFVLSLWSWAAGPCTHLISALLVQLFLSSGGWMGTRVGMLWGKMWLWDSQDFGGPSLESSQCVHGSPVLGGDLSWTHFSRCSLTNAEWRGNKTSQTQTIWKSTSLHLFHKASGQAKPHVCCF